jgi:glycerol-3-phosphate O-acyltransferase / dihydroxyacetone phosphate acyltransferase
MTDGFYAAVRGVARFWVWFFFKAVDVRHPERVPRTGPVLLCINHPNNLIDSLLVGAVVPRKLHYLAAAALFRHRLVGRFLRAAGAIPVYRRQDDPDKMDRNVDAFIASYATFDAGGVVAIYPEGTTHSEARVQRIKTGAARLALEYESRRPRTLALVPIGLTFEARKSFRARVLVSFGPPVPVSAWLEAYREEPPKAVDALSEAIQVAMEAEVVHVDRIDEARLVRAVEELYRGELARELREERGLADRQIDLFRLSRSIVGAVEHFKRRDPARVERLWQSIQAYRALLAEHRIRDEGVRARLRRPRVRRQVVTGWEAVLGFPIFAYGVAVNWLPHYVPRWIAHRVARRETDYATTRFLAAVVAFPLFWGLEIGLVWHALGARAALLFAPTLPLSGVLASRYLVGADRIGSQLKFGVLALRHGADARRLVAQRQMLMAELERAKDDYLAETRGSSF